MDDHSSVTWPTLAGSQPNVNSTCALSLATWNRCYQFSLPQIKLCLMAADPGLLVGGDSMWKEWGEAGK